MLAIQVRISEDLDHIEQGIVYQQKALAALLGSDEFTWYKSAYEEMHLTIGDPGFPCLFARKAWKNESCHILYCGPLTSAGNNVDFYVGLTEYAQFVKNTAVEDRLLTPLVAIFQNTDSNDAQTDYGQAWATLQWLHDLDPVAWPDEVSADPDASNWCFCFNGIQLFFNISSRHHLAMRSRNLGKNLTMIINPRQYFDVVASASTRAGQLIREKIRNRVAVYNGGTVPKELGFFGSDDSLEWKQYQLDEPTNARPAECPLRTIRKFKDLDTCQ